MKRAALSGFAVDLGGTKLTVARVESGDVVDTRTEATNRTNSLSDHLDHVDRLLTDLHFQPGTRLGVAVTGLVSGDGRWSAINADTLPEIRNAPLLTSLEARFGPATCCNDALAATVAEMHFGVGRGCQNMAYITVSTGIGGGLVLNGRPVIGKNGLAGHFGFTTSFHAEGQCGSGRVGTVESVASGSAIARLSRELGHGDHSAKDVFEKSAVGLAWADDLVEQSARCVASLIANVAATVDPEIVAIGGSIGLAAGYVDRIERCLLKEPPLFRVPVSIATLGQHGPLLGALAFQQ